MKSHTKETFEEWLSTKLQNRIGNKIGKGNDGSVYEYGNNDSRVIKIGTTDIDQLYPLLDKDIKGIAKVYHIGHIIPPKRFLNNDGESLILSGDRVIKSFSDFGKTSQEIPLINNKVGYVIMERVDTSIKVSISRVIHILYNILFSGKKEINILSEFNLPIISLTKVDCLNHTFDLVKKDYHLLKEILNKYDLLDLVYEVVEVLSSVSKLYPNWTDIHSSQFGINNKNELVAFGISNDVEETKPFRVNNLIRENHRNTPQNIIDSFMKSVHNDDIFNHSNEHQFDEYDVDGHGEVDTLFESYIELIKLADLGVDPIELHNGTEVEYISRLYISDDFGKTITIELYDPLSNSFDTLEDDYYSDDIIEITEYTNYTPVVKYTYSDWVKTRVGLWNTLGKLNENNVNAPIDVLSSFGQFHADNKDFNDWCKGYYYEEYEMTGSRELDGYTNIYAELFRIPDTHININGVNIEYLARLHYSDLYMNENIYGIYNPESNSFEMVDEDSELYEDLMDNTKRGYYELLSEFTYEDWMRVVSKIWGVLGKLNEGSYIKKISDLFTLSTRK